jgi:hypothetical protein
MNGGRRLVPSAPSDGLRVIVGDEAGGPRSQLWRVWTGDRTSDVYVGARPIAGDIRVSLHESGRWRLAFTATHQKRPEALIGPDEDRARSKWARPAEFAPGLTRAFAIEIPSTELRAPTRPDPLRKPALWIPAPPHGTQWEIDLFLTRGVPRDEWPGQRALKSDLLYRQDLPNGEELLITGRVVETSDDRRRQREEYKRSFLEAQRDLLLAATHEGSDLRGVMFNMPGEDAPADVPCSFTDVALPRPT